MGYGYRVADNAETVMIDPFDPADSDLERELAWIGLIEGIKSNLPPAWQAVRSGPYRSGHPGGRVIAHSALHELMIEEDRGGYGYVYVSVAPRPQLEEPTELARNMWPLALRQLPVSAKAIFDRLADVYDLRIPQGYVSRPYKEAVAA